MAEKKPSNVRVRFAPSPTGWMHLGNARIALLNAFFAKKYEGTFILRIEDTDQSRNIDPEGKQILKDLAWLGITIDEGPTWQSKRNAIYQQYLDRLIAENLVYRCFETNEELEQKRQRQLARGLPPKYDRAGLKLSPEEVAKNLAEKKPFIWRLKLPAGSVQITDIAHGVMTFELENFSDISLTRQDGTFTFIFANCVDDIEMKVSHVIRGGDHLTNTTVQAVIYDFFKAPKPIFYHTPLLCSKDGKKLSKRDFGASLDDFKRAGFLPEALCNYLGIIGGTFTNEIMPFDELAKAIHFDESSPKGTVHFDMEKLRWVNHKWIGRLSVEEVTERIMPFLKESFPESTMAEAQLKPLIALIQSEMTTLRDAVEMLGFIFTLKPVDEQLLMAHGIENYRNFFSDLFTQIPDDAETFVDLIKAACKAEKMPLREVFALMRIALTGNPQGIGLKDLISMLGMAETKKRLVILTK